MQSQQVHTLAMKIMLKRKSVINIHQKNTNQELWLSSPKIRLLNALAVTAAVDRFSSQGLLRNKSENEN